MPAPTAPRRRLSRKRLLGIDREEARRIGIDVYKVGMVWPLESRGALDFVQRKNEVLVIEEKRGIIESQFKEYFYDWPGRKPERMVGKYDENQQRLVPWVGELSPVEVAGIVINPGEGIIQFTKGADPLGLLIATIVFKLGGVLRIFHHQVSATTISFF